MNIRRLLPVLFIGMGVVCLIVSAEDLRLERVRYGTGEWDAESLGNHRAVVHVAAAVDAVAVRIPWRRRDSDPKNKSIVVIDAATGKRIRNLCPLEVNREYGDLVFQPVTAPGDYHVYYLVNVMTGRSNYPTVVYPGPENTCELGWLGRTGLTPDRITGRRVSDFPEGRIRAIQAIDDFHRFDPMEVIATQAEIRKLLHAHPQAEYLLFPEDRRHPIRMRNDLPLSWIERGPEAAFRGEAARGEFYVFQVGIYACRSPIEDLDVRFEALVSESGEDEVPAAAFTCFNTEGLDWQGIELDKTCPVPLAGIQPLWCGFRIPPGLTPGEYRSAITIAPVDLPESRISLELTVNSNVLRDAGDGEPWRHSRLRWLNSSLALDDEIVAPYTPVQVKARRVDILGRSLLIGDTGLPEAIQSHFTPEVTSVGSTGRDILSAPIRLLMQDGEGRILPWTDLEVSPGRHAPGAFEWTFRASAAGAALRGKARMEFDGFVEFLIELEALEDLDLQDIRLEIPFRREAARYMMGMGAKGGFRPERFFWKWDPKHNQDSVWMGDINAGLQCGFRDQRYARPLNTNFYLLKPLIMPESWWNDGKGECEIRESGPDTVLLRSSGGPRRMARGQTLRFDFSLLITPFRPLDTGKQWATRYYHRYDPLEKIAETGANTVNVHHATGINPFINYPFLRPEEMKAYIDEAHDRDMNVKIYYTVRELSNRAPELFALFSLGDEIFFPGEGGGFSWLQEHLEGEYIAAWFVPDLQDAAVINSGVSRWHNYYVEGLNWLVKNVGIDGLYIDDVAFDRTTMKRVRKVMDRNRPRAMIDLHSANQFNVRDGFANSANLYLEHFPYIDRLWFGEYFDYDSSPDFWLVEVSGIPFGLMGEMLQDGGNPWRGMLFGMTSRLPWAGNPAPLWKAWDEFGISSSRMFGFWSPNRPVRTGRPEAPATSYVRPDRTLLAIASWAKAEIDVKLEVNWSALGLEEGLAVLTAPAIPDFQPAASFRAGDAIPLPPGKGWLIVIHEKETGVTRVGRSR